MTLPAIRYPDPPAQVSVYSDVLGIERTIDFLLAFGGAEIPFSRNPGATSRVAALIGPDLTRALAERDHLLPRSVPLAKRWLAACFEARGMSRADIARTLRCSEVSVRKWLGGDGR